MLGARARSLWNGLTRTHGAERRRARMAPFWTVVAAAGIGWASYGLFDALFAGASLRGVPLIADRLPAFAFLGAFWLLVLSGLTVGIQGLYISREIPLLLAAPLRPRTVFAGKFVDMTLTNAALFGLMGGPLAATYAMARGYLSVEYAMRGLLAMLAFCATPTAIGVVLGIVAMRMLPAHRMRDMLAALGLALLAAGYVGLNLTVHRMQDPTRVRGTMESLVRTVNPPIASVGPWSWAGDVLATPSGYPEPYAALGLLAVLAAATVAGGAVAAEALHWRGWTDAQETVGGRARSRAASRAERVLQWMPGPIRAFFLKDLRSLLRDMRQLSLLLMPGAVVVVFLLNLRAVPEMRSAPHAPLSLIMLPLVGMIALRIATSAFVGENRAMWIALASPAGARMILVGKLCYTAALTLPLALAAMLAYGLLYAVPGPEWLVVVCVTAAATLGLSGIGVGVGGRSLDLSVEGARPAGSGASRMLALGLQIVYCLVIAALMVGAWLLAALLHWPPAPVYIVALAGTGLATVFAVLGPITIAAAHLERMED